MSSTRTAVLRRVRERYHPLVHLRRFPPTRMLLRLADRPYWARVDGIDGNVRVRLVSHWSFVALGTPEPRVTDAVRRVVATRPIRSFWDVGGNFGYYSWLVKSLRPETNVTVFEPDAGNLELIRATAARNGVTGLEIISAAVSSRTGTATFARDPDGAFRGTVEGAAAAAGRIAVPTISLDSLQRDVDLVKIDVEGHEEAVIEGARATLERCRPIVVVECSHPGQPAVRRLEALGYRAQQLDDDNFLLVHDD